MKILQKQTLVNGEEELTSSQADFLASLSPSQVRERERMITVTSGRTCSVLYEKSDPLGLLVKTLLESSQWFSPARRLKWEAKPLFSEKITEKEYCYDKSMSSKPSVKTLNEKDIPSNRCLFRLVPLERPTEETGCGLLHDLLPTPRAVEVVEHPMKAAARTKDRTGTKLNNLSSGAAFGLLPTPMASDATTGVIIGKNDRFVTTRNGTPRKINQNGQNGSVGLARMVRLLPTPNAREADKYSKKYNPNSQMGTALTAMAVNGMLPTPIRRDYQPSVSPQTLKRKDGKMRTDSLCNLPVMCRKREVLQLMQDEPMKQRLLEAEQLMREKTERGSTFFPPTYIPRYACTNRQYPTVEDVFRYVTDKNATLDAFEPEGGYACMSMFHGLCE